MSTSTLFASPSSFMFIKFYHFSRCHCGRGSSFCFTIATYTTIYTHSRSMKEIKRKHTEKKKRLRVCERQRSQLAVCSVGVNECTFDRYTYMQNMRL